MLRSFSHTPFYLFAEFSLPRCGGIKNRNDDNETELNVGKDCIKHFPNLTDDDNKYYDIVEMCIRDRYSTACLIPKNLYIFSEDFYQDLHYCFQWYFSLCLNLFLCLSAHWRLNPIFAVKIN